MESIAKMGIIGRGQGEAYWVMGAKYTFKRPTVRTTAGPT